MKKLRLILICSLILIITELALPRLFGENGLTRADGSSGNSDKQIVRVYFPDRYTANKIFISFEGMILETNYNKKYHIMSVTPEEMKLLVDAGLEFEIDTQWTSPAHLIPQSVTPNGIAGFPCDETVEETYAEAQAIVDDNPNLASWIDVGDSWEKTAGLGGHDMMVLVLTNSAISGDKPKFFATAAIHAREYAGAPLCLHFAKYLVNNYGINADATWILDYHEIHLMFITNPDGRKQAEAGLSWRKNTNRNYCGATSINRGADLNRNFEYEWGCCGESSGNECDIDYRGPHAVSEPETQAVQAYMRAIFPDQRGAGSNDAAPDDATGIFIDFHSYSESVIWPWGYTSSLAPNGTQMQTLGRKFAYWNGYLPDQGNGLYDTSGTSKDFCYGDLGVPSFVFELGTAYFQSCTYYENNIVPGNLPAMIYAAKVARTPYKTPAGPNVYSLAVSADHIPSGTGVTLTAAVDDTQFNNSNGTEPTQNIAAAEYYVDTPPWINSPTPVAISMSPSDGIFNNKVEIVKAQVDTTGWSDGQHIIFVRGRDVNSNWGAFSAVFLNIASSAPEQVAIPIFSPTPEAYDCSQGIQIICSSSDAKIYYTINGDDPTENSRPYEQPIYFNDTTTLKARAYKSGWIPSDIATENYVISDTDGDGIGNCEEQGPNGNDPKYDGNGDGIADSLQGNIASLHTYDGQSYVTLASQPVTSITNCKASDNPSSTDAPSNVAFFYGFFGFTIIGAGGGSAKTVTLYFPAGTTFDTYYKYGPTPNNTTNHWYEFLYDGQTGAEMSGNVITLHFIDGARGDDDLTANGNISDTGGPGISANPGGGGDSGGRVVGSSGGGGGCFITTSR
jgi:carboxypeptidase T